MDLIDEKYGPTRKHARPFDRSNDLTDFFHSALDGRKFVERSLGLGGENFGQSRLTYSGRPPKNHGWQMPSFERFPQYGFFSDQMPLAQIIIKRSRPHALGQRNLMHVA